MLSVLTLPYVRDPKWVFYVDAMGLKGVQFMHPFEFFFLEVSRIYHFQDPKLKILIECIWICEAMV